MDHRPRLFALGAIGVALIGCATRSPFDRNLIALAEDDLGPIGPRSESLLERATSEPEQLREPTVMGDQPLDAEDYVLLALERNPAIRAAERRVLRLGERIDQVTSLDDPMLQVAPIGEMAQTAAGEVDVMTGVSQRLPFPGKLATRGRIAEQDVAVAEQQLERVRLAVVADTRGAYWSLYFAVRSIEVTHQNRSLLSQLRDVAQAKYRAGTTTQEAVLRASVELNSIDNELIKLEQRRATAAAMLNSLIDSPVEAPIADPPPVTLSAITARLDELLREARRLNPSIQRIREELDRYREQRELARLGRYPDLTVSLSYNAVANDGLSPVASGDDQWWVGFGVNLPIWQVRLDAAEREATHGMLESAGLLADEQNRVAFRVQDAFVKVETQQRQLVLLRDVIVPEARQTVEASLSGYRAGSVDFLTLVDNWRKLLDFQLMYEGSLSELERSFAGLQEAVGHDLDRQAPARSAAPAAPTESENQR